MNYLWNLDSLYHGFDDPAFQSDVNALRSTVAELEAFAAQLETMEPLTALRRGIALQEELIRLTGKAAQYAELRVTANTTDSEASSQLGTILNICSGTAAPLAAFDGWAAALPQLPELMDSDPVLSEYRFLLENKVRSSRHLLSGIGEAVMAKLQLSGGSAWAELQQYLTSTVPIRFRGETTSLTEVRNMAYSADAAVRREAYEAELAGYQTIAEPVAYALNSIKLETISDCQLRGYASPLDRTLQHSFMKRETLDAMFTAIDEYLPKFWQYLRAKAALLGHENGLPWYDLFAPLGRSATDFTPEQCRDYLVELFSHFDEELCSMVQRAFDDRWIDFYPRKGKTGGAFCASVECLGESRILTNYNNTLSDAVILAHELGHAFHNHCLHGQRPLNRDYSMPVAETASTFNECVVMNHAIAHAADDQEKLSLLETQLRDVTQIICDIYSRYRFETAVFANRGQQFMHADTLCQMMLDAQKQSYGDGLDHRFLHPYMWVCKSHYYGPTFYNFPYAFGGLFARGLYAKYTQEGEAFLPKYKQLLRTTPVATAEDTAKVAGIDLTDVNFWRGALQIVSDKVDLFCQLAQKV